jgi:AcrR family transcriptional regulator
MKSRRPTSHGSVGVRFAKAAARRDAILDAALDEFSARGFAATRLDDVAKRADVAKGTIYLHFKDKESLFQELIRSKMAPVVGTLEATFAADLPLRLVIDKAIDVFVREVYGSHRKDLIRLIISEGPRFPALAEFYYREVLSRILKSVRGLLRRALERGELADNTLMPPVIYSLEERSKLVYMIEALPQQPSGLRVGQPVDVKLLSQALPAPQASR